jgi:molybdopterin-containing oxidoreductase family iron-sulfur binding subunit
LVAPVLDGVQISAAPAADLLVKEDALFPMNTELKRALEKPASDRRWVMVIDLRRCIGCHACTMACIAENKLPLGAVYRPVMTEEIGMYPNVSMKFLPRP